MNIDYYEHCALMKESYTIHITFTLLLFYDNTLLIPLLDNYKKIIFYCSIHFACQFSYRILFLLRVDSLLLVLPKSP